MVSNEESVGFFRGLMEFDVRLLLPERSRVRREEGRGTSRGMKRRRSCLRLLAGTGKCILYYFADDARSG